MAAIGNFEKEPQKRGGESKDCRKKDGKGEGLFLC